MASLGHGILSSKESMLEISYSSSVDCGKNVHKKKLEKKRWEVKIKLSHYTPRKAEEALIIPEVSTSTRKITLEEIYLNLDVIHVMKKDTLQETILKAKIALTRRRETREDIMLMLQRMMNIPQRESDKKVMILQVLKNMFLFLLSWETSHMEAMIGL